MTHSKKIKSDKPYLSLEEVADLLGVTYQLIYRQVRSGHLKASRIGRIYRVSNKDLEDYLEKTKQDHAGGVCASCGTTYQSAGSLRHVCVECDAPICVDCWLRKGSRVCRQHQRGKTTKHA